MDFTEAIRIDPKSVPAYSHRGTTWVLKGQYDKAIADFTEVTRIDPSSAFAYGGRAIAWQMKREHHKAIDDFTEAIRLDPTNVNLIDLLATAYAAVGNFDAAVEWEEKAVQLASEAKKADRKSQLEAYKAHKPYLVAPWTGRFK